MLSDWKSLPLLFNDVEVKLYHRENRGRCRTLRIEADTGIKEDEIVAIVNAKGDYEIIYEVVGINGKKPIKLRFHPHILEAAKKNEIIQEALKRTTYNMVSSLLSADWTLTCPPPINTVSWKDVQELFVQQAPLIRLTNDCRTLITWKVTSENLKLGTKKLPRGKKAKEMEKYFAKIEKRLSIHVSNVLPGNKSGLPKTSEFFEQLTKLPLSPPSQLVDIIFSENDFQKTLLTLEFAGFPPLDDLTIKAMHQFIFNPKFGTIQLDLLAKPDVTKKCTWIPPHNVGVLGYAKFNKISGHLMIDCAHYRLQELPRDLSDSLDDYPKAMILESDHSPESKESSSSKKTPLEALFLSTNTVAVQIEATNSPPRRASLSTRFQVSPVSNAPPPAWRKASDPTAIKPLHVDALSLNVATSKNSMVISPSDSIDSGVISPGIVSDDCLRLSSSNTTDSPRPPKLRERSASECFPNQTIPIVPGLKGILKKPKSSFTSSASSGLRRSPAASRMLFARSISECHDNSTSESSGIELEFLGESNDTLASSSPPRSLGGFFNRVEEENESEADEDSDSQIIAAAEIQSRKKRVSFSEHVQARIYRTGSSIIGQKKKNERRNRCRRNRSSGSTDSDGTLNGTDDENSYSISPAERLNLEKLAKEFAASDRSGIVSSPIQAARNLSTDSAYDDEIDSETEKRMEMLTVA